MKTFLSTFLCVALLAIGAHYGPLGLLAGVTACFYVEGLPALCRKFKRDNEAEERNWVLALRNRTYAFGPEPPTEDETERYRRMRGQAVGVEGI